MKQKDQKFDSCQDSRLNTHKRFKSRIFLCAVCIGLTASPARLPISRFIFISNQRHYYSILQQTTDRLKYMKDAHFPHIWNYGWEKSDRDELMNVSTLIN